MTDASRQRWEARHRDENGPGRPSSFVTRALALFADEARSLPGPLRALDVACGRGRHALVLAEHHYRVEAVDFALAAVRELVQTAQARGLDVHGLVADVTRWPLPRERYALVVVTSFLERALFPALRAAIVPGGALLYETFVRAHDGSPDPMRPEFLLEPGELEARCAGWRVLLSASDTVVHHGASARRAGILAQRPFAP